MGPRLLPSLRRRRALFALALCAWLALAGAAWGQGGCCASTGGMAAHGAVHAHATHGGGAARHVHDHLHAGVCEACACAHAPAVPAAALAALPGPMAKAGMPAPVAGAAPQPARPPPLRPPSA